MSRTAIHSGGKAVFGSMEFAPEASSFLAAAGC
jgi:hypothetical protein